MKFVIPQKVLDERPIARLEHREEVNIGIYIDMERFSMMEIRDEYSANIRHMVEQMKVKYHVCRNLSELKRRQSNEKFTQIFIGLTEYKQEQEYSNPCHSAFYRHPHPTTPNRQNCHYHPRSKNQQCDGNIRNQQRQSCKQRATTYAGKQAKPTLTAHSIN